MNLSQVSPIDLTSCTVYSSGYNNHVSLDQEESSVSDLDLKDITVYEHVDVKSVSDLDKLSEFTKSIHMGEPITLGNRVFPVLDHLYICEFAMECVKNITAPCLKTVIFMTLDVPVIIDTLRTFRDMSSEFVYLCIEDGAGINVCLDIEDEGGDVLELVSKIYTASDNDLDVINWFANFPNLFSISMDDISADNYALLLTTVPNLTELQLCQPESLSLSDIDTSMLTNFDVNSHPLRLMKDDCTNACDFSNLKILDIYLDKKEQSLTNFVAPKLEELTICGNNLLFDFKLSHCITSKLKKLHLYDYKFSVADLRLGNVEELVLSRCTGSICINRDGKRVKYGKLTSLRLVDCEDSIACIDAPILTDLTIMSNANDVNGLFRAKLPELLKLNLRMSTAPNRRSISFKVTFPLVEELTCDVGNIIGAHNMKFPSLTHLKLPFHNSSQDVDLTHFGKLEFIDLKGSNEATFIVPSELSFTKKVKIDHYWTIDNVTMVFKNKTKGAHS